MHQKANGQKKKKTRGRKRGGEEEAKRKRRRQRKKKEMAKKKKIPEVEKDEGTWLQSEDDVGHDQIDAVHVE